MVTERIRIGQKELSVGDRYYARLNAFPVSENPVTIGGKIEDIRGGGFYGRAIILEDRDIIIKTAEPDSWHLLWRKLNWKTRPFPPQTSENAALLDHLSTRIIHIVVPLFTEGEVITPDSYGYIDMGPLGYAQVLERMHGHGARFGTDENARVRTHRKNIWNLGISLGLEHAAQIHPKNPFGKQNVWLNENGQIIWLDTLPAIRHTGFVLPAFHFRFHKEVKEEIGNGKTTFNHLHTERLKAHLHVKSRQLGSYDHDRLEYYLSSYESVWGEYQQEIREESRTLVIADALRRGMITQQQAETLCRSSFAYRNFIFRTMIEPAARAFSEFIQQSPIYRAGFDRQFQRAILRFFQDPDFRQQRILENTVLKGTKEAYLHGLITEDEWNDSLNAIATSQMPTEEKRKLMSAYALLQTYYIITGRIIDSISYPTMISAPFAENPGARFALGFFIDMAIPPIIRVAATTAIAAIMKQNLSVATKVSAWPKLGSWLALSADFAHRSGNRSEMIWHYTKRGLIASLSKMLRPWGGWNTDLEERLYDALRVEKW